MPWMPECTVNAMNGCTVFHRHYTFRSSRCRCSMRACVRRKIYNRSQPFVLACLRGMMGRDLNVFQYSDPAAVYDLCATTWCKLSRLFCTHPTAFQGMKQRFLAEPRKSRKLAKPRIITTLTCMPYFVHSKELHVAQESRDKGSAQNSNRQLSVHLCNSHPRTLSPVALEVYFPH